MAPLGVASWQSCGYVMVVVTLYLLSSLLLRPSDRPPCRSFPNCSMLSHSQIPSTLTASHIAHRTCLRSVLFAHSLIHSLGSVTR